MITGDTPDPTPERQAGALPKKGKAQRAPGRGEGVRAGLGGAAGNQTLESDEPEVQTCLCVTVDKPRHPPSVKTMMGQELGSTLCQVLVEGVPKVI